MQDSGCELHQTISQSHTQFPSESQKSQHTESSFNPQHYDLEDLQRDVPQALLFPHSLDTAAPGRQVLLRHQRVILAPPTPPPTMTGISERDIMDEKNGGMMRLKMERVKRWWFALKQRATPKLFPQAWLLFLIIILIAVGAIVTGWGGLAVETVRHQTLTRPADSSATSAARPAPPNLEASASTITSSGLTWYNHTGYGTAMTAEGTAWSPRSTLTVTGHRVSEPHVNLTFTHASTHEQVVKKEVVTDYEITHVTTVITDWVTSYVTAVTVETTSLHDSDPGMSVAAAPSTSSQSSESRITAAATSENRMFCPDPRHPGAWTLCAPDHDKATGLGGVSTAIPSVPAESSARRCSLNPFSLLKTMAKTLWKFFFHHDEVRAEAMRHVERYNVLELGCQCQDLKNLALAMVDIIEVQQRMLDDKDEQIEHQKQLLEDQKQLLEDQKLVMKDQQSVIEWNKGVFVDAVAFISNLRNDTMNTLKKVHEMNGGNTTGM